MKINQLIFGIVVLSLLQSCMDDSARSLIDFTEFIPTEDTTFIDLDTLQKATAQPKNVLIEDFTGVKCSNCPDAAAKIRALKEKTPGRIVSIGIHAGGANFVNPKSGHSENDFRTQDGNNIAGLLKASGNLPEGDVDRVKFSGEPAITTSRFVWGGNVEARLQENNPLSIDVNILRNDQDTLVFLVRVLYHQLVDDNEMQYLAVYLSEDGLVDYQYDILLDDIEDYNHEHVFRKSVTNYAGDSLKVDGMANPYIEGRVFQRRFVVPIQKDVEGGEFKLGWNHLNLNVVAFVHRKRAEDFEVIHVIEKHVSE